MNRLSARSALITGGASGLGRAVAEAYLDEGANVVIFDRSENGVADFIAAGESRDGVVGDVRNPADHERAVAHVLALHSQLDIYVGNAGIWDYGRSLARLSMSQLDQAFDEVMSVNVKGYLLGARAALPALIDAEGCMIFTLSNAAFFPDGGGPLYTASKHAALGIVRQLAFECAPCVRVNAVAPGAIASDLRGPESLNMSDRSISTVPVASALKDNLPIDGWAQPEDYAAAFVYLASAEESAFATGSVINVDGGYHARGLGRGRGEDLKQWREQQ